MTIEIGGRQLVIYAAEAPTTESEISRLCAEFPGLPSAYLDLLRIANGFAADFGEGSDYVVIYPISDAREWNRTMDVPNNEPGFFMIGGNGGADGFFVSTNGDDKWMVLPPLDIGDRVLRLEYKFESAEAFASFLAQRLCEEE